jgi:NTP pyrophosphatase (non-canonical NTP hydrolase)
MFDNLVAEVGEFAGKVAKMKRRNEIDIVEGDIYPVMSFAEWTYSSGELMKEAGDILWQLAGLCYVMGWDLEDVAEGNLDKLASRQRRGVIDGEGDNR